MTQCQPQHPHWRTLPQRWQHNDFEPIAKPPHKPHYVIPKSQYLDPPYSFSAQPTWPYPRAPLKWETESRQAGTGLLTPSAKPPPLLPPPTCPWPWGRPIPRMVV